MEETESQLEARTSSHLEASTSSLLPMGVRRAEDAPVDTEIELERLGAACHRHQLVRGKHPVGCV
jgi:hypothetical protein